MTHFSNYTGGYGNVLQAILYKEKEATKVKILDHLKQQADHHWLLYSNPSQDRKENGVPRPHPRPLLLQGRMNTI